MAKMGSKKETYSYETVLYLIVVVVPEATHEIKLHRAIHTHTHPCVNGDI